MDRRELEAYEAFKREAQSLRQESRWLRHDRDGYRRDWYHASQRVGMLEGRVAELEAENRRLRARVKELTLTAAAAAGSPAARRATPRRCGRCPTTSTCTGTCRRRRTPAAGPPARCATAA